MQAISRCTQVIGLFNSSGHSSSLLYTANSERKVRFIFPPEDFRSLLKLESRSIEIDFSQYNSQCPLARRNF